MSKNRKITEADLATRVAKLERILLCSHCTDGVTTHLRLGKIACTYCGGSGNRLDELANSL